MLVIRFRKMLVSNHRLSMWSRHLLALLYFKLLQPLPTPLRCFSNLFVTVDSLALSMMVAGSMCSPRAHRWSVLYQTLGTRSLVAARTITIVALITATPRAMDMMMETERWRLYALEVPLVTGGPSPLQTARARGLWPTSRTACVWLSASASHIIATSPVQRPTA